jgi:asparagine synthase (glutamine-hydrolysing)
VPFLDERVAAASLGVDDALKLASGASKPLLVDAVRDLLPREVWDRPKQGFTLPFERWMRGALRADIDDALMPRRLARVGIDAGAARAVWQGFSANRAGYTWARPWALYTLVRWAEGLDVAVDSAPADVGFVRSGR